MHGSAQTNPRHRGLDLGHSGPVVKAHGGIEKALHRSGGGGGDVGRHEGIRGGADGGRPELDPTEPGGGCASQEAHICGEEIGRGVVRIDAIPRGGVDPPLDPHRAAGVGQVRLRGIVAIKLKEGRGTRAHAVGGGAKQNPVIKLLARVPLHDRNVVARVGGSAGVGPSERFEMTLEIRQFESGLHENRHVHGVPRARIERILRRGREAREFIDRLRDRLLVRELAGGDAADYRAVQGSGQFGLIGGDGSGATGRALLAEIPREVPARPGERDIVHPRLCAAIGNDNRLDAIRGRPVGGGDPLGGEARAGAGGESGCGIAPELSGFVTSGGH